LPAVTPDRATDFFGLNAPAFGVLLSASLMGSSPDAWGDALTAALRAKNGPAAPTHAKCLISQKTDVHDGLHFVS
jgi:hypothetical protein